VPRTPWTKFKLAIEKRDYQAAGLYVSSDYKEFLDKGRKEAEEIAKAIDDLRHAMKSNGVKSAKGDYVLFLIDPFRPASSTPNRAPATR